MRSNGQPVHVGRRRERCLLGILLLHVGTPVPADRLISLLWENNLPRDPRSALHTYVSRLRRGLGTAGGIALTWGGDGYQTDAAPELVDALRFRLLVAQASTVPDSWARARARALRAAVRLRRGPLLADVATEAVRQRLGRPWDEAWLAAQESAIEAELACGRHRELISELTALSAEHPFRERFTGLLMSALYRCGRTADALATYARTERLMREELAIAPGPDLRDLQFRMLHRDPALNPGRRWPFLVDGSVG